MGQFIPNEGENRWDTASGGHQGLCGHLGGAGRKGWQSGAGGWQQDALLDLSNMKESLELILSLMGTRVHPR